MACIGTHWTKTSPWPVYWQGSLICHGTERIYLPDVAKTGCKPVLNQDPFAQAKSFDAQAANGMTLDVLKRQSVTVTG
jgi:hypothetical protein